MPNPQNSQTENSSGFRRIIFPKDRSNLKEVENFVRIRLKKEEREEEEERERREREEKKTVFETRCEHRKWIKVPFSLFSGR